MVKLLWRRQRWHLFFTDMRSSRSSRYWFGEVIFDYHSVQTFKNRPDNRASIHALNALRCAATLKDTFFIRGVLFFILLHFCCLIFSGRGPNYFDWSLNFWLYSNIFLDEIKWCSKMILLFTHACLPHVSQNTRSIPCPKVDLWWDAAEFIIAVTAEETLCESVKARGII